MGMAAAILLPPYNRQHGDVIAAPAARGRLATHLEKFFTGLPVIDLLLLPFTPPSRSDNESHSADRGRFGPAVHLLPHYVESVLGIT